MEGNNMFVTKDYQPKRIPTRTTRFGGENDAMASMTKQAESHWLEYEEFLKSLNADQQRAVNEALCRLNDYVAGAGHKRIFGIIIPSAIVKLMDMLKSASQ
jgi:hypothetical protein